MKQKKRIIKTIVKENKSVGKDHFVLRVIDPYISKIAAAGQFVNIKVNENYDFDPLLRIPLGIHRLRKNETSFLYKVVGRGTSILSGKRKGDKIDILGPLGKGFDTKTQSVKEKALLIAGGHGIAPLYALAEQLLKEKKEVIFFIGACEKKHVIFRK
ncbi:MAG: hypothetical protein ABH862_03915, partial [Candidatus Omnitrophota bacterium]